MFRGRTVSGPNMLELYGTEGSIVLDHGDMHFETRKLSTKKRRNISPIVLNRRPSALQQWINSILRDEPMHITIQDGRNLTELMQAFYISADQGVQ